MGDAKMELASHRRRQGDDSLSPCRESCYGRHPSKLASRSAVMLLLHTRSLKALRAQRCDFVDLVQPGNSLVTAFRRRNRGLTFPSLREAGPPQLALGVRIDRLAPGNLHAGGGACRDGGVLLQPAHVPERLVGGQGDRQGLVQHDRSSCRKRVHQTRHGSFRF